MILFIIISHMTISFFSSCEKDEIEFGSYEYGYNVDTIYKAESDGFVVVNVKSHGSLFKATLYSDENPEPITEIASVLWRGGSMTAPIKKNNYWKVSHNNINVDVLEITIGWMPIN